MILTLIIRYINSLILKNDYFIVLPEAQILNNYAIMKYNDITKKMFNNHKYLTKRLALYYPLNNEYLIKFFK